MRTLERLGYPARNYFTLWLIAQAFTVGVFLGWIVVEPRMWWMNLLSIAMVALVTWGLFHVYLWTDRGFRWIDRKLSRATQIGGKS